MFDAFLSAPFVPFTLSIALLLGLLILEIVMLFLGSSLMGETGGEIDAPELDGPEFDLDLDASAIELEAIDIDGVELDTVDSGAADVAEAAGISAWLGFGKLPAAIWIASNLAAFGLAGLTIQSFAQSVIGTPINTSLAALPSVFASLWFTRNFGHVFARVLPKTETESVSERHLGRRRGVVSQGTAERGRPAEVRILDRHGNSHYLRAEPLRDDTIIPMGSEVVVMRHRRDEGYRIVPLSQLNKS